MQEKFCKQIANALKLTIRTIVHAVMDRCPVLIKPIDT